MQTPIVKYVYIGILLIQIVFVSHVTYAATEKGEVPADKIVWSSWYWPLHDDYNPNLYDAGEAMERYDDYDSGAKAQSWEYNHHGPPQNPESWWGHCHAWAGAACWEKQPSEDKTLNGVTFRMRDRKGLMTEIYDNCADGIYYELFADDPSPGLFWRYLRDELRGGNPIHDHGMAFVGELHYGPGVWNYPIYKYKVDYNGSSPYSGTMTIWVAADGDPSYADSTILYYRMFTYQFQGVTGDGRNPVDSGTWIGSGPYHRPDAIWRPYPPETWTQYSGNPHLDEAYLKAILSDESGTNEVSGDTVTVPGNTPWTDSGITVSVGNIITFSAQGTIAYYGDSVCGPGGTSWADIRDRKDPLWQQPHAGLIGKIKETGLPFFIGEAYTVKANSSGTLLLGINDYWYHGNSGKFTVTIRITNAS